MWITHVHKHRGKQQTVYTTYTNTEVNNKPFTLQDKANRCESTKTPDGTSWLRQKNKEKGIRPTLR